MIKGIFALLDGMITVFKHLFKRPVTLEYPEKTRDTGEYFRGKPETRGCIGCGICLKVCPSGAIKYEKNSEGKVISSKFDLRKCIFCGNCSYYCPKGAINMSKDFELGTENKEELVIKYQGGNDD